ncbi:MAG: polysaccharide pyruvyl transferase family protein [Terriglobales bacterium]
MRSSTPIQAFILGASFETENMGVSALAAGAIKSLLYQFPQAEISLLDYARESKVCSVRIGQVDVQIPVVNMRFSKRLYLSNNVVLLIAIAIIARIIPAKRLSQWVIGRNKVLRDLSKAIVCLSVAGGDSFSDIYGLGRLIYVSLPQVLVLLLGKRLILLPQTIGPFKSRSAKLIARFIMTRASRIYARDYLSVKVAEPCIDSENGNGKVRFCYDLAFVLDSLPPRHMKVVGLPNYQSGRSPLVGVNVSGLLMMGGYTKANMFGLKTSYASLVRAMVDHMILEEESNVLLIPHVFGTDVNSESDLVACERVYQELKSVHGDRIGFVSSRHNQSEIKKIIGSCDFFIGARMHACIAALSQNVPAVALAYSDKFKGVMETLGVDRLVVDPRNMDEEEVLKALSSAYKERGAIRRELERKMPEVRSTVLNLFAFLNPSQGELQSWADEALPLPT